MGKKIKVTRSKQNEVSDGTFPVKANTQIEKSTPRRLRTHTRAPSHAHNRTRT